MDGAGQVWRPPVSPSVVRAVILNACGRVQCWAEIDPTWRGVEWRRAPDRVSLVVRRPSVCPEPREDEQLLVLYSTRRAGLTTLKPGTQNTLQN